MDELRIDESKGETLVVAEIPGLGEVEFCLGKPGEDGKERQPKGRRCERAEALEIIAAGGNCVRIILNGNGSPKHIPAIKLLCQTKPGKVPFTVAIEVPKPLSAKAQRLLLGEQHSRKEISDEQFINGIKELDQAASNGG